MKNSFNRIKLFCKFINNKIIILTILFIFVDNFCFADNFPSLNLASHCSSSNLLNGFNSLFYCQSVEEAVQLCQKNNKSVQIALGGSNGAYSIGNATQGEVFAKRIWGLFLGGNGPRPFGRYF